MAATDVPGRTHSWLSVQQAGPAIYGTIVGASVMATGGEGTPVADVAVTVVVTLIVYWLAERWSFVLGTHLTGEPLTFHHVRHIFAEGWSMVQASYLPLVVMLGSYALGASADLAVNLALTATVVLLIWLGVLAGRRGGLAGWAVVASAGFTGLLGVVLIVLKSLLHH